MSRSFDPPPHFFNPDDKRSYLLTVFLNTPFVTLSVPTKSGGFRLFDFPSQTGIYALHLTDASISQMIPPERRTGDLPDDAVARLQFSWCILARRPGKDDLAGD
jgi:hypothetical protein